jgi:hypothetical protein
MYLSIYQKEKIDNLKAALIYLMCELRPFTQITRSGQGIKHSGIFPLLGRSVSSETEYPMEKFLGIFPRIGRNFSMNMWENFPGIFPKLIPRKIHSKTPIFLRNSEVYFCGNFTRN